jgi:hypothetical protein
MSSQVLAQGAPQNSLQPQNDFQIGLYPRYLRCMDMVDHEDSYFAGINELKSMLEIPSLRIGCRISLLLALAKSSRDWYECRRLTLEAECLAKRLEAEYQNLGIVEARICADKMVESWLNFFSHTALEVLTLRLRLKKSKPEGINDSELLEDTTTDTAQSEGPTNANFEANQI